MPSHDELHAFLDAAKITHLWRPLKQKGDTPESLRHQFATLGYSGFMHHLKSVVVWTLNRDIHMTLSDRQALARALSRTDLFALSFP